MPETKDTALRSMPSISLLKRLGLQYQMKAASVPLLFDLQGSAQAGARPYTLWLLVTLSFSPLAQVYRLLAGLVPAEKPVYSL